MASHALATVTNPDAALTDFTLIVDLSTLPQDWWDAVTDSDGTKGRVYKSDGSTRLACAWINFNDTAETGLLRVKWAGSLASSGTQQLWIEPPLSGNAAVVDSDTYGADNAFDANWEGYWPDGGATDYTVNALTLSGTGSPTEGGASGKLDKASEFNGSQHWAGAAPVAAAPFTTMAWANIDDDGNTRYACSTGDKDVADNFWGSYRSSNGPDSVRHLALDSGTPGQAIVGQLQAADGWGHMVGVEVSAASRFAWLDGVESSEDTTSLTPDGADTFRIGASADSTPAYWDGQLCEVQLHSVARADAWIGEEYAQSNNNATFWGSWSWVAAGGGNAPTGALEGPLVGCFGGPI